MASKGCFPDAEIVIRSLRDKNIVWKILAEKVSYEMKDDGTINLSIKQRPVKEKVRVKIEDVESNEIELNEKDDGNAEGGDRQSRVHVQFKLEPVGKIFAEAAPACASLSAMEKVNSRNTFGDTGQGCHARDGEGARCSKNGSQGKVRSKDGIGKPGHRRKSLGGGNRCSVAECRNTSVGHVSSKDTFGEPGRRCFRHGGGTRCSVLACKSKSHGLVSVGDAFGEPGRRCSRHGGGKRCSTAECNNYAAGKVSSKDAFGEAGYRCARHGGGNRCSVRDCGKNSKGLVNVDDAFGAPGRRCYTHGGGRTKR